MLYGVVYGLFDPRDQQAIRYLGQTTQDVNNRLRTHISARGSSRHSSCWIRSLIEEGHSPGIVVLASASSQENLDSLEEEIISEYRSGGYNLTNHSSGGRSGRKGTRHSKKHKEALSRRLKENPIHTPELMRRLAEMKRGVPRSNETKAKISKAKKGSVPWMKGRSHSSESIRKLSEAQKGNTYRYRVDLDPKMILELYESGMTMEAIAKKLNTNRTTVRFRLRVAKNNG